MIGHLALWFGSDLGLRVFVLSCLLTLYTAVMRFGILFPFWFGLVRGARGSTVELDGTATAEEEERDNYHRARTRTPGITPPTRSQHAGEGVPAMVPACPGPRYAIPPCPYR